MVVRRVVTGTGADGRSRVVSDGPPPTAFHATSMTSSVKTAWTAPAVPAGEAVVHQLWSAGSEPARGVPDPTPALDRPDFETPAGETSWIVTEMGPGLFTPMHHTATIDYGLVVRGEVELGLDDGAVLLRAGDAVVVDGVEHSWRAGPDGCTIATVQVGYRTPDRG